MANKTLNTRIILRNDTAANWTTNKNKVLLKGEIGLETDTHKYKIGDGSTTWENLTYYKNIADGTVFGLVDDVKVDGTSVVSSKIASLSTINGDYNASTNKLATEDDIPTTAAEVGALPDSTKYGAGLSVSGTTVQLLDQDGNNLGTAITTQDTGATVAASASDVYQYNGYTTFTTTADYIGFLIGVSNNGDVTYTEVTNANKDTLGIVAGTTVAYKYGNGGTGLSYNSSNRTMTLNKDKVFVELNDIDTALSTTSRNPVQNKKIAELVPAQANSSNQLADKAFVNSSIATATATFRGTYNVITDLSLTPAATQSQIATALASVVSNADNNDYCFVQIPTSTQTPTEIARIDRYKYDGTNWEFEYSLNNSGFTASQWEAINSGITSTLVTKLNGIETGAQVNTVTGVKGNAESNYRTGNISIDPDDLDDTSTTNKFVTASEKTTWSGKQDAIDSSHKLSADLVDDTNTTNKFVTATEKSTWSGKQDALTAGNNITINNNTISSNGTFYAIYGTTKFAEIATAILNGLTPICRRDIQGSSAPEHIYYSLCYAGELGGTWDYYKFSRITDGKIETVEVYEEDAQTSVWSISKSSTVLTDDDTYILDGGSSTTGS